MTINHFIQKTQDRVLNLFREVMNITQVTQTIALGIEKHRKRLKLGGSQAYDRSSD
jgi:hypothetical protein